MWTGTLKNFSTAPDSHLRGDCPLGAGHNNSQPTANHDVLALIQELMKSGVDKKTAVSVPKITNLPKRKSTIKSGTSLIGRRKTRQFLSYCQAVPELCQTPSTQEFPLKLVKPSVLLQITQDVSYFFRTMVF